MTDSRRCPQCDAEIPANSPAGLCPRCLLQASADSQSAAPAEPGPTKLTPPNSGFVPPTVEELAPLFPQLEILELLGKGGMGAVYKARQPGLDRLVALKILPPEISHDPAFAERFQREARALAKLNHPHIVAVYDFGQTPSPQRGEGVSHSPLSPSGRGAGSEGQLCYIVMEFIDGANLRQTIKAGNLASAEALAIVPQICEALQFAHDEGIVHRDIKPENILIDKRGRVKIADFGLAKLLGTDASDHSLTATHQVMGTLRYMAPEQMQGSREVDHRADIYSLGVVFYELLTGELPMGKFAPPSKKVQVDVRLDEIVLRALEQDPEQRYQHASDVKSDMESVQSGERPAFASRRTSELPAESHEALAAYEQEAEAACERLLTSERRERIRAGLAEDEHLIWADKIGVAGTWRYALRVGLTLIGILAGFFVGSGGLRELARTGWDIGSFASSLVGVLFVLAIGVTALLAIGRRERVFYTLTNRRAIVWNFGRSGSVSAQSYGPTQLASAECIEHRNGSGNLIFEKASSYFSAARGFKDIDAVREVHDLIRRVILNQAAAREHTSGKPSVTRSEARSESAKGVANPVQDSGEPGGVSPRTSDEEVRGLTPAGSPSLPAVRPKLVPVLATMNLIGAILLMLICAAEEPTESARPLPRLWRVWEHVDSFLGFSMAAGMFAASIGLFLWKPWARKLTLVVSCYGLASVVFDAPYIARVGIPELHEEIRQSVIEEGIPAEAQDFVTLFTIVCLVGGILAVGLTWLIGQLVYFSRPRVIAAFESPRASYGKFLDWLFTGAGVVVGLLSVYGPLALLLGLSSLMDRGDSTSLPNELPPPPSLGTITSGIGAEFTVPAGQVAVFEIVTRRDNETVPVPPHCGYVMAPPDTPVAGTFRWSRKPEKDIAAGRSREWSLEIVTGSSNGYTEAILLPDELNAAVGSRKISLGVLTPNEEATHWGTIDTRDLPANGLIGLRVTVVAHEFKTGGSGNAHIDWKKAQSATSTTRRKLPADSSDSLHSAAEKGDVARVKQLLDGGASLNAKDADGQTPLMKAVAGGHKSLALTLILLGADLAEQDQRGRTAEMIAAEKRDATFLSRLKALSEMSYDRDPAKRKERLRSFAGIEPSLLAGRDVDLLYFSPYEAERLKDNDGENALMKAARSGDWECFNLLATQLDTMVAQDKLGRTVLMHAVLGGHAYESRWKEQIEWLTKSPYFGIAGVDNIYVGAMVVLDLEKSLSVLDRDAKSVLQLAEQRQHTEVARILRRHLEMIITNQTAAIEKSGDDVAKHYRLRGLAWQALGNQQQAEAEFKKAIKD